MSTVPTYFLAFFVMILYALMPVLLKKLQFSIPPLMLIAITMAILCAFATVASICFEKDFSILKINQKMWANLVFAGAVNFIGFATFMFVVAKIPIVQYQLIALASPIITGAFSYWLLREEFKLQYLIGLIFIAIGLFIVLRGGVK